MASPVYSVRFLQLEAGTYAQYTVPAGYRAVLRCVDTYYNGSSGSGAIAMNGPAGQIFWAVEGVAGSLGYWPWRGRQVFLEGETFAWFSFGAADVTGSGYLLTLP